MPRKSRGRRPHRENQSPHATAIEMGWRQRPRWPSFRNFQAAAYQLLTEIKMRGKIEVMISC